MDRLLLKATVTATDEGLFTAVISTAAADRENDSTGRVAELWVFIAGTGWVRAAHAAATNPGD